MQMYFWCSSGEDGTSIVPLTENQLKKRLAEVASGDWRAEFVDEIPRDDGGCWMAPEATAVIIKGEIVMPKAVQLVTAYEVP